MGGGDNPNVFWVVPQRTPDSQSDDDISLCGYSVVSSPTYGAIDKDQIEIDAGIKKITFVTNGVDKEELRKTSVAIRYIEATVNLYFGRHDKRKRFAFESSNPHANGVDMVYWFTDSAFGKEDIGKPTPVWISTEPPPY